MYAELELKICTKCGIAKEKKEFGAIVRRGKPHSHCKDCKRAARTLKRKRFPEEHKAKDFAGDLKKHYGITVDQYNQMREAQDFKCACCGQHESNFKRRLHVDHCHESDEIRALLCTECNPGLGYFKDSVDRLQMAISYLRKFKK